MAPRNNMTRSIKATVGKLKLRYGLADAKEVSALIGGPKKSTLKDVSKCKVPVLDYFYDKNIKAHLQNAKCLPIPIPLPFSFSPFYSCLYRPLSLSLLSTHHTVSSAGL